LSLKVGLRAVDLADEGMVLYIGHAAVRAMPPLRGELLRSMMMGQQGGSLRCAPSMRPPSIPWKNIFMQKRRSNKCPRVTTQSMLPGLSSYTNYVHYNTLIDSFRDTRPM